MDIRCYKAVRWGQGTHSEILWIPNSEIFNRPGVAGAVLQTALSLI